MKKDDKNLVYYGPHPCQKCDKRGTKGTLIVKAGNGVADSLEFDFPKTLQHDKYPWAYPNNFFGKKVKWEKHICIDITQKSVDTTDYETLFDFLAEIIIGNHDGNWADKNWSQEMLDRLEQIKARHLHRRCELK